MICDTCSCGKCDYCLNKYKFIKPEKQGGEYSNTVLHPNITVLSPILWIERREIELTTWCDCQHKKSGTAINKELINNDT
jgi:hypothetical protein